MNIVPWLLVLHFIVCLALLGLRLLNRIRCEYISILIAFFVPVWGIGMLLLKRIYDRHRDRIATELELKKYHTEQTMQSITLEEKDPETIPLNEALVVNDNQTRRKMMMDILYEINRSITRDSDETDSMTVPLEEAMIVNDPSTRRSLLIEALYSNPADYVPQLLDARSNEDTEVVHYAAIALTEIQKHYDMQFQDLAKKRLRHPDDKTLDDEYLSTLEKYIGSGLLKGDGLRTQLRSFSNLLQKKLAQQDVRGRWSLLRKKADADLRLGDADALDWDIQQMETDWQDRECYWIYRIESAVLRKDAKTIKAVIAELNGKDIYMSQQLRSVVSFWGGQRESAQAAK